MPKYTWIVAALLALAAYGCSSTPRTATPAAACPQAHARPVYLDIQDFQQALNNATTPPRGNWTVSVDTAFGRFDRVIAQLERARAARSPACRGDERRLAADLERLRVVRARGEEYVGQLRAYLKAGEAALTKLRKEGIAEARLGDLQIRLSGLGAGGQSFFIELRNSGKRALNVATHYEPADDRPDSPVMRPGYFVLSDEYGTVYPVAVISPAYPPQAPLTLAPNRAQELRIDFGEPYPPTTRRLTLLSDPSLVASDPQRLRRAPAALVLPAALIPRDAQPLFVAEPGGARP